MKTRQFPKLEDRKLTFAQVLTTCVYGPFADEWARLRGVIFARTKLDQMIDDATGNSNRIAELFIADVRDLVWDRLPIAVRDEDCRVCGRREGSLLNRHNETDAINPGVPLGEQHD